MAGYRFGYLLFGEDARSSFLYYIYYGLDKRVQVPPPASYISVIQWVSLVFLWLPLVTF